MDENTGRAPHEGHPDAWVKQRLADMGLSEDDIGNVMEGAGGLHAHGGRWKICPGCKANIDMLTMLKGKIDGVEWPHLLIRSEIECPNCGSYGETMGDSATDEPHAKLKTFKAQPIHNPLPWSTRYIRLGKMIVEQNGLFPADPQFDPNEPHWPRDLAACIVGSALILASTLKKLTEDAGPRKPAKPWAGKSRFDKQGRQGGAPERGPQR